MEFDAILVYEISPITQAYPALYCKKKYGGKVLLWVQDLWPESVTAAGGINNKFALGILERMVKRIYEKCDVLLVQSDGFRKSILSKGDLAQKIVFVPNWAEDLYLEKKMIETKSISEMMPDGFKVMFAGNVGAAQDIDSIVKAANETKDVPDIKYVIVGDGRARAKAEEQVKQMGLEKTVYFMGRHPMAQMPTFFSFADVMVVSLKDEYIFSLTIPAKTQSYLASGKPVVTMLNGEGSRIVEQAKCGLTAPSGDYKKFAENIKKLYHTDKAELEQMGKNGFEFYKKHFDKKMVIDNIIESMKQ
jgi:glycosyltransferase involved in cell wall biosynthesis